MAVNSFRSSLETDRVVAMITGEAVSSIAPAGRVGSEGRGLFSRLMGRG